MQAMVLTALCAAVQLRWEDKARRAFLRAFDARVAPILPFPRASQDLLNPSRLYLVGPGTLRCGRHAARRSL